MELKRVFGNRPVPNLLDFMLSHSNTDYPISQLRKETGISHRTLQTILPFLVKEGILSETRRIGNAKFYSLNLNLNTFPRTTWGCILSCIRQQRLESELTSDKKLEIMVARK